LLGEVVAPPAPAPPDEAPPPALPPDEAPPPALPPLEELLPVAAEPPLVPDALEDEGVVGLVGVAEVVVVLVFGDEVADAPVGTVSDGAPVVLGVVDPPPPPAARPTSSAPHAVAAANVFANSAIVSRRAAPFACRSGGNR
jgi:hypothetical protein